MVVIMVLDEISVSLTAPFSKAADGMYRNYCGDCVSYMLFRSCVTHANHEDPNMFRSFQPPNSDTLREDFSFPTQSPLYLHESIDNPKVFHDSPCTSGPRQKFTLDLVDLPLPTCTEKKHHRSSVHSEASETTRISS